MAFFNRLFGKSAGPAQDQQPAAAKQGAIGRSADTNRKQAPGDLLSKPLPYDTWLALKGAGRDEILQALAMTEVKPCSWEEGLHAASGPECWLFITKPVEGYNLVFGSALPDLAYRTRAASWITDLGANVPQVYAFTVQKSVQVFAFAHVEEQKLCRIYAVAQGSVRVNKGERSDVEEALGYQFPSNDDELFEPSGLTAPGEDTIRAVADYWSIDPGKAVGTAGLLGRIQKI